MNNYSILGAVILLSTTLVASWLGVALFRRWSVSRELVDIPNERSSHSTPVPRGGGLIIVLACLLGYAFIALVFKTPFSPGYFVGASLVALVSWIDDLYSLAFWKRLLVHCIAAGILVADLGVWLSISLPLTPTEVNLGVVFGTVLTIAWIVGLLNAYNFMDGIDGIAGLQAVVAGVGWALVAIALNIEGLFLFAGLFAVASFGFLLHNWPPARIFMGDVGSAFLGFTLAAMPLLARREVVQDLPVLHLVGVALVWLFVSDTILTMLRRLINGERVWEAHRSHVYQRMVIAGRSHRCVTLMYGSAAAIIAVFMVLSFYIPGNLVVLSVSLLVAITMGQVYVGHGKNR